MKKLISKKILTVIIGFNLFTSCPFILSQETRIYMNGDVNGDGDIDITDSVGIFDYLFREASLDCLAAADVNYSNSINLTDGSDLLNALFQRPPLENIYISFVCEELSFTPGVTSDCDFYNEENCFFPPPTETDENIYVEIALPEEVQAIASQVIHFTADIHFCNDKPISAWSFGLETFGCKIISATTDGTHASLAPEGSRDSTSYELTEVTTDSNGAVSSVILALRAKNTLSPTGSNCQSPNKILTLNLETSSPFENCEEIGIEVIENVKGSGRLPIRNIVVFRNEEGFSKRSKINFTRGTTNKCPALKSFLRADANSDGWVNIADPVLTLGALFVVGLDVIPCEDSADANGDLEINITDPIFTLGVLFLGKGIIPPPGMDTCGVSPEPESLGCEGSTVCR